MFNGARKNSSDFVAFPLQFLKYFGLINNADRKSYGQMVKFLIKMNITTIKICTQGNVHHVK